MALHWQWNEKCGEITVEQKQEDGSWRPYTLNLYKGNAWLIIIWENSVDNTYSLYSFFNDKDHAKNCFGLGKGQKNSDNIFSRSYERWTKIRINKAKYPHTKDLVTLIAQAFDNITIEVYREEDKQDDAE